ncbi:hypothetical protein [Actinosynnema sp. NPDC023587]|uniref:hypothetical protein n=1 Tax=Actinosynnema sp. NPDC023587 TaxID=3154695 RepID=UPI0033FAC094
MDDGGADGLVQVGAASAQSTVIQAGRDVLVAPIGSVVNGHGVPVTESVLAPGRLISDTAAEDLEVRRTLPPGTDDESPLPRYIPRQHDLVLRELARAAMDEQPRSGTAILVSDSTSGKTRALYELLHHPVPQPRRSRGRSRHRSLTEAGWRVWPPINPVPADQFLSGLAAVEPHTVIWLNEAQRYLIDPDKHTASAIASGLRALLADSTRTPVLLLGTLWPLYLDQITQRPQVRPDRHADARALLSGRTIPVPGVFTGPDLAAARSSSDTRVRRALAAADGADGGPDQATRVPLTQYMAGVPELLDLYSNASTTVAAVLHAAMDARRLGHSEWLPVDLLHHAAPAYLDPHEQQQHLTDPDWFTRALHTLTTPRDAAAVRALHRPPAIPGQPIGDVVRLEDYLDEYGRSHRAAQVPPVGFWTTVSVHANPDDLDFLGDEAWALGLYRHAGQILKNATAHGNAYAAARLVRNLHAIHPDDHRPAQWAVTHVGLDDLHAVSRLLEALHETGNTELAVELAERISEQAELSHPHAARTLLEALLEVGAKSLSFALAKRMAGQAIISDDTYSMGRLLSTLNKAGASDQVSEWTGRMIGNMRLDDPYGAKEVLLALHQADAAQQVSILAKRIAEHSSVDDPHAAGLLLEALHETGAAEQVGVLAGRAARSAALKVPWNVGTLLSALHKADATAQIAALLERSPSTQVVFDDLVSVRPLLSALHDVGATDQIAVLAERMAEHVALHNLRGIGALLVALLEVDAVEHIALLTGRITPTHTVFDSPYDLGVLLTAIHGAGSEERLAGLLNAASIARLAGHEPQSVGALLEALHRVGATSQVDALAEYIAASAAVNDIHDVDALLNALYKAGATEQAATLISRAAQQARIYDRDDIDVLLTRLRESGAVDQIAALADHLAVVGRFDLFMSIKGHRKDFRFGREPDGKAALPWTWDDLKQRSLFDQVDAKTILKP